MCEIGADGGMWGEVAPRAGRGQLVLGTDTDSRQRRTAGVALAGLSRWGTVWAAWLWPRLVAHWRAAACGVSALSVLICLSASRVAGFPLDDSWIHQDFARTFATTGQFAFEPGRGGAGSTSPLWVLLLAPPQFVARGQAPTWVLVLWSALLGACCLAGLGIATGIAARMVARSAGLGEPMVAVAGLLAALATTSEWHLVWAAASGMETVLFALLTLVLLVGAARGWHPAGLGLIAAATIATRPEGALVAGLVALYTLAQVVGVRGTDGASGDRRHALVALSRGMVGWVRRWLALYVATLLVGLVPYAVLNLAASGRPLPSTFYAKAEFYGTGSAFGILVSYAVQVVVILLLSSPALLVLGLLSYSHRLLTRMANGRGTPEPERGVAGRAGGWLSRMSHSGRVASPRALLWTWPAVLLVAYAIHLPVTYHHARYEMPALPPLIALASAGAAPLLLDARRRMLATVGAVLVLALGAVSVVRAAQIYASNVSFIDDYQVRTALWLREHTPAGALVATHDVGAIGYFSQRPIVDMAGLVDPQVVPLLADQRALRDYLVARHVQYVAMFTDWFPEPAVLVHELEAREVYSVRSAGGVTGPDEILPGSDFVVYWAHW